MPGSKGQKAVHACMIRLLNLGPTKHEKVAIYAVNQRISNVLACPKFKNPPASFACVGFPPF